MSNAAPSFFSRYTQLVPDADLVAAMESELNSTVALLRDVSDAEANRLHPPYTWTIRQVLGHVIDAERIFGYRALRLARADATPLPGFDENAYAEAANFNDHPLASLLTEYEAVRCGHVLMFAHFPAAAWDRRGEVNGNVISVSELAQVIVGHERHHLAIVRKRLA